jgi:hypothetical protein
MAFEIFDVEELTEELEGAVPRVSEHMLNTEGEEPEDEGAPPGGAKPMTVDPLVKDKYGRPFDPEMHETDGEGNPVFCKSKQLRGYLRIKNGSKRPRDVGGTGKSRVVIPESDEGHAADTDRPAPEKQEIPSVPPEMIAALAAGYTERMGVWLGGPEWWYIRDQDKRIDEERDIRKAFTVYFQSRGVQDLPPGWVLVLTIGQYAMLRLHMPETQKRGKLIANRLKRVYYWMRGKVVKDGARDNHRHDRERQNDAREKNMQGPDSQGLGHPGSGLSDK